MSLITVKKLSLQRGNTPVLHHVSFEVQPGEILVLIGPSGSGKSSLLRCLNRLDEPPAGTIFLKDTDLLDLPVIDLRRRVGMVFQKTAILAGTVRDNIRRPAHLHHLNLTDATINDLMQMVSLPETLLDKPASELSGGQEQRMAIARALVNQPDVLLLDEPTSALDPIATRTVEESLLRLREQTGLTLVWVSHLVDQARRVADRVLLLEQGRVIRVDTVDTMLDPVNGDARALAFAAGESGQTTTEELA